MPTLLNMKLRASDSDADIRENIRTAVTLARHKGFSGDFTFCVAAKHCDRLNRIARDMDDVRFVAGGRFSEVS